jgi:hypothetical protein
MADALSITELDGAGQVKSSAIAKLDVRILVFSAGQKSDRRIRSIAYLAYSSTQFPLQ